MEITNFYSPRGESTLMKIKWDPNENQKDMDVDQKWRSQQKDLIIPGVYD